MLKKFVTILVFAMLVMTLVLTSCAPAATEAPAQAPAATQAEVAAPTEGTAPTDAPAPTEAPTAVPEPQPTVGGTYVFTTTQQPDTLDHQKTAFASASVIVYLYNGTLLTQDLDGNYVPYLAESYEVSNDGMVLTFKLKDGIKFHNGDPVDANVMKFSFERMLDPDFVTNNSKTLGDYLESIEVLDDMTLRFTLNQPWQNWARNMVVPLWV
jgi:peptide/nickel transport system substrate-binding protein